MKLLRLKGTSDTLLKEKVIDFWITQGCLSAADARSRVSEVFYIVLDESDEIIAVSSGKPIWVNSLRGHFLYYRSYTKPENRKQDLSKILMAETKSYLDEVRIVDGIEVKGIYIIYESEILNTYVTDYVRYSGLTLIGWTTQNQQIRVLYLDGASFKK